MVKNFLKDAWRSMGFGLDGRADHLLFIKSKVPSGQVMDWFNVSNSFSYHLIGTGRCKEMNEVSRLVSQELIFRANEKQIAVFSRHADGRIPTAFRKSSWSEVTKTLPCGEVFLGNDMFLSYRTVDAIDAIIDVCRDLKEKGNGMVLEYLFRAAAVLGDDKSIYGTGMMPGFMRYIRKQHFRSASAMHAISVPVEAVGIAPELAAIMARPRLG